MASKKVKEFVEETGSQLASFESKTLTKLFKKDELQGHTVDILIQEPGNQKAFAGKYTIQGDGGQPPEPGPDKKPVVDAGEDAIVVEGAQVTLDGSAHDDGQIVRVEWKGPDGLALTPDSQDPTNVSFIAPTLAAGQDALGLIFKLEVEDDKSNISTDSCIITVTKDGHGPPIPPPSTGVLWNSNTDGKWNNGVQRTVTNAEGNVGPDGKGLYTAASGNPRLVIEGNGIAHLVAGSGTPDNISLKLRSRHQEGSACANRAGGEGIGVSRDKWDIKRETCHNIHDPVADGNLPNAIKNNEWHVLEFTCQDEGTNKIRLTASLDGKEFANCVDSNAEAYFFDKALLQKNSYIWIRINNSDHGRIYICALNYNSKLTVPFMFEDTNSVALKDVELVAL